MSKRGGTHYMETVFCHQHSISIFFNKHVKWEQTYTLKAGGHKPGSHNSIRPLQFCVYGCLKIHIQMLTDAKLNKNMALGQCRKSIFVVHQYLGHTDASSTSSCHQISIQVMHKTFFPCIRHILSLLKKVGSWTMFL